MADFETSDSSEEPEHEPGPTRENINPQSIEGLFLVALEKTTPAERAQFLDEKCGDNLEQRRRVEALLLAYEDAGSFLENSPLGSGDLQPVSLDFLTPSDNPDLLGTLGEYEIQEVIGQGGMGIVFRALDPKLNRIVAIKVMSPLLAINPNARKRFLREAQAAAAVSHPHIVTIHAVDEDQLPYLVMEYVVGQSLQEKLDKVGSLPVTEILRIGNQIAEGLAAAHKQGLIHRDIKPANILLENGVERVKITDFGLARAVDDVTITKTGEVSGTPQYMSPEQATGIRVDQRSDLFSLGAVLYAMCTGRSPFRASNLAAVVRRVCDDSPRPIEEVNEDIPDWLIGIVERLLEKRPDDRIQTAAEVAELLGNHLARVQQPGRVSLVHEKPRFIRPQRTDSLKSSHSVDVKGFTPAVLVGNLLFAVVVGIMLACQLFKPYTPDSVMTYQTMNQIFKVSFTFVFILALASIIRWNKSDENGLPFLTWFLSITALFMALWLSFMTTTIVRTTPPSVEFQLNVILIFAASVMIVLAVAGFALRRLCVYVLNQKTEYIQAVKAKDSRVLLGIGIVIWVFLVLWYLAIAAGFSNPVMVDSGKWILVPIVILFLLGGVFVSTGFLLQKSVATNMEGDLQQPVDTSPYADGKQYQKSGSHQSGYWGDRFAVWAGGLLLLVPLFLWGIGSATGWHFAGNVLEMVIVSLLFCGPVGLLVMVCGAQNMVQPGSTSSKILDGLFLLGCFFAGPVGVLLYIANYMKKRDSHFKREDTRRVAEPRDELIVEEQRRSNKRVLAGVGIGVGFLVLVWGLSYGLGVLRQSQITISDWFFVSTVSCLIMVGLFLGVKAVRSNFFRETIKSPWKILGWMILCVPLLFLFLFMVFLLVPMFARASNDSVFIDYDPKNPIMQIEVIETGKKYKHISHPALIKLKKGRYQLKITFLENNLLHTFERGIVKQGTKSLRIDLSNEIRKKIRDQVSAKNEEEERKKNRGGILLLGQTPGLRVGLFPVDPMQARPEDGGFGFADRFYVLEPMTFEVPAGFYDVKVSSSNMGWVVDYSNPQYSFTRIEVKPGKIFTVEVSRDYKKLAENQPDWSMFTLFEFVWPVSSKTKRAKRFKLTGEHGKVVQQLLEAFADGTPDVAESDLLKTANSAFNPGFFKTLKQKFNDGKHPAWGTLIVPGKAENTFRLVEPQIVTAKTVR